MTTGKRNRLAEKLNADLEAIRKEHADLMASQLQSFRSDIQDSVRLARDTIETDTSTFLDWSGRAWQDHINTIRRLMRISPWMASFACLLMVFATLALTLFWSWQLSEMTSRAQLETLGLQTVQHEGSTYLILPLETASIRSCTMAGQTVSCIKVEAN